MKSIPTKLQDSLLVYFIRHLGVELPLYLFSVSNIFVLKQRGELLSEKQVRAYHQHQTKARKIKCFLTVLTVPAQVIKHQMLFCLI